MQTQHHVLTCPQIMLQTDKITANLNMSDVLYTATQHETTKEIPNY